MLSDWDIIREIRKGTLVLDVSPEDIQPGSVDLVLGHEFLVFDRGNWAERFFRWLLRRPRYISLHEPPPMKEIHVPMGAYITIPPHGFVLGTVLTKLNVPRSMIMRIEGKSSIGRIGVSIHKTAGFCDPGYEGTPTLEFGNDAPFPVRLYPGQDYVCQISIDRLETPAVHPYGSPRLHANHYQHVDTVSGSRTPWDSPRRNSSEIDFPDDEMESHGEALDPVPVFSPRGRLFLRRRTDTPDTREEEP